MKNYITSDKIGEFVQSMYNAGFENVIISPMHISVKHTDGSYTFIDIYDKLSYEALLNVVFDKEKALLMEKLPKTEELPTNEE